MECVLADETETWGGEFWQHDNRSLAELVSLFGDDLLDPDQDPLGEDAETDVEVPSPS